MHCNGPTLVYSTSGDWVALIKGGHIYDTRGEWIAWLDNGDIYTCDGFYAGYLADDNRVLRQRNMKTRERRACPQSPDRIRPPSRIPLPPQFAELPWHVIDCFEEEPEVFTRISDLRPDWED